MAGLGSHVIHTQLWLGVLMADDVGEEHFFNFANFDLR